jgi:hypothetical protein
MHRKGLPLVQCCSHQSGCLFPGLSPATLISVHHVPSLFLFLLLQIRTQPHLGCLYTSAYLVHQTRASKWLPRLTSGISFATARLCTVIYLSVVLTATSHQLRQSGDPRSQLSCSIRVSHQQRLIGSLERAQGAGTWAGQPRNLWGFVPKAPSRLSVVYDWPCSCLLCTFMRSCLSCWTSLCQCRALMNEVLFAWSELPHIVLTAKTEH